MTTTESILTILAIVCGTMLTRFLPFLLFPAGKPLPPRVARLGAVLPGAVIGLLVVFGLKDDLADPRRAVPALLSVLFITALHLWKKNTLLSIAAGTAFYMTLIQTIFRP